MKLNDLIRWYARWTAYLDIDSAVWYSAERAARNHLKTSEPLWTPKQVAARLAVSVDWVHDHVSRKEPRLPVVNLGTKRGRGRGVLRFRREDIEMFIEQQCERSMPARVM